MKNSFFLRSFLCALSISLSAASFSPESASAIGYGGIGGEPAQPREDDPRTESIFIHTIESGGARKDSVRVINNTDSEKKIRIYAVDSEIASGGTFSCRQFAAPKSGVGSWITLQKQSVVLAPASNKIVPFELNVPSGALPGGHDGCIVIEEENASVQQSSGINLRFRTGIRVSVTVPGDIRQEIVPVGFSIETKNKTDGKKTLVLNPTVRNVGNIPVDTKAEVYVDTLFGKRKLNNEARFTVPRGESSGWNFETDSPFWGGFYKAGYSIEYEQKLFPRTFADAGNEAASGLDADQDFTANIFGDKGNGIKDFKPQKTTAAGANIIRMQGPSEWFFVAPVLEALIMEASMLSLVVLLGFFWWLSVWRRRWIRFCWAEYKVQRGDDINKLAEKYDVSWKIIAKANRMNAPYALKSGQEILLPPLEQDEVDD